MNESPAEQYRAELNTERQRHQETMLRLIATGEDLDDLLKSRNLLLNDMTLLKGGYQEIHREFRQLLTSLKEDFPDSEHLAILVLPTMTKGLAAEDNGSLGTDSYYAICMREAFQFLYDANEASDELCGKLDSYINRWMDIGRRGIEWR